MRPRLRPTLLPTALLPLLLAACTGGGGAPAPVPGPPVPGPTPTPTPAPGAGTTLTRAQISGCPNVSGSSDINAPTCLKGTVVGKTLGGDPCTLTIGTSGNYSYVGKNMSYRYTNAPQHYNFFAYETSVSYLLWTTYSQGTRLEIKYNTSGDFRMQMDAESNGMTETCVAQL